MTPIREAWRFLVLVLVLSVPFYLLGLRGGRLPGPLSLPTSALMTVVPMLVALVLTTREQGLLLAVALLGHVFDVRRIGVARVPWLLAAVLFMPFVAAVAFVLLRLAGTAVPAPRLVAGEALLLVALYFLGAIGEEVGWQGYAYPRLRTRHRALTAALTIGSAWALWHVIPYWLMGRSAEWIVWQCLGTVALRVVIAWLFENAGRSVLVAVAFHTMLNVTWTLFPVQGSYYDPRTAFAILLVAVAAIVALWGPGTLARHR